MNIEYPKKKEGSMYSNIKGNKATIRMARVKEIIELTGLSRSTIYRRINSGEFPSPYSLGGRAKGFLISEVEQWILTRTK